MEVDAESLKITGTDILRKSIPESPGSDSFPMPGKSDFFALQIMGRFRNGKRQRRRILIYVEEPMTRPTPGQAPPTKVDE